jgi:glycosyltransferase involved in cell wall biosynthesis
VNSVPPKVSIGVPVYNGGQTLKAVLDALLQQTFPEFEIVISDNASTDGTAAICEEYAAQDSRIRYIRQPHNIGAERNFKFVLEQARGPYFMWSAADDVRSPEFLEENVRFLEAHPDYVASTCPNRLEGRDLVAFSIEGDMPARFYAFFDHSWVSHGIFYAVIRTDVLRGCEVIGQKLLGADWALILYLASRGPIHRTQRGLMVSGVSGMSNQRNAWRPFRTHPIGWVIPFYRVSLYTMKLSSRLPLAQRWSLLKRLIRLNAWSAYSQLHTELYPFYAARIKPWVRAIKRA